jgi:hypothetical protein
MSMLTEWPEMNITLLCSLDGPVISHLMFTWIASYWILHHIQLKHLRWRVSGERTSSPRSLGLRCCSELWREKTGTRLCTTAWFSPLTAPQRTITGRQTVETSQLHLCTSARSMSSLRTLYWISWLVSASDCWWKIWDFLGIQGSYSNVAILQFVPLFQSYVVLPSSDRKWRMLSSGMRRRVFNINWRFGGTCHFHLQGGKNVNEELTTVL